MLVRAKRRTGLSWESLADVGADVGVGPERLLPIAAVVPHARMRLGREPAVEMYVGPFTESRRW